MLSKRNFFAILTAICLAAATTTAVLLARRADRDPEARAREAGQVAGLNTEPGEDPPDVVIRDFSPKHYMDGRPAWEVKLQQVALRSGGRTATVAGLQEGLIYDKDGKPTVRVTAQRIDFDTNQRNFEVTGAVRIVSSKGAVVTTERVLWDHEAGMLRAPGHVSLTSEDVTANTTGLDFDTQTDTVNCPNLVNMNDGKSDILGHKLVYRLDTGHWELRDVQMVLDLDALSEKADGE